MINLIQGDCLEVMKSIPDKSIDFILTDPPYGTIKNAPSTWDKNKTYWDIKLNTLKLFKECERVLRVNGCMALFSQDPYTAELNFASYNELKFSYRYTWCKESFGNHLGCKKFPVNFTEDICIFFNNVENKTNHPLSNYFITELTKSKKTVKEICKEMNNTGVAHYFTKSKQFRIPSEKQYFELKKITNCFDIEYKQIVNEFKKYADIKIFNLQNNNKYKSNLLKYKKDKENYHPTQKPILLLEDLIKTYTNENDVVLDFTMGSGSTGVACKNLGRKFIGIEQDANYFEIAKNRIEQY
jgi:site-specific DNA-methyltransferase (adenine-specific)